MEDTKFRTHYQNIKKNNKITFEDVSWPIKIAIIMAWISGIIMILTFLAGFFGA